MAWRLALAALGALLLTLAGCGSGASLVARSQQRGAEMSPDFHAVLYENLDENSAEIYLTNIPERLWRNGTSAEPPIGVVVHISQFYRPHAFRTPIAETASNSSVRVVVFTGNGAGVYGGGGFLLPSGEPGDALYGGSLLGVTLRLLNRTDGFADRLGVATLEGSLTAKRDPLGVEKLRRWLTGSLHAMNAAPAHATAPGEAP